VLQVHAVDLAPAWREAEERQIVRGHLFAHDLMREAVLRTLPSAIASELHGQIAAVGPSFAMPARLRAMHLEHAGQPGPAAQEYAAAALDAGRRGAWLAALQLWDRAAACERARADDGRAFAAERTAAAIALEVCDLEQGQHRIDDLLARAGSGRQRAQALVLVARSAVSRASFDEAHSAASAALEARDVLTDIDVAQAAGLLGLSLSVLNRTDEALALFDSHESVLERLGDRWVRSEFRSAQAYALAQRDRLRQAVAYWEEAAQGAFEAGRVGDAVVNLNNAAGTSSYLGRFEQALAMAERALFWQRSMSTPHTLVQASATMLMGTLHTALGRFEQAHDQLLHALQDWQGESSRVWRVVAENCLCNLYHLLGQEARARQALRTPLTVGESGFARRQILLTRLGGRASAERLQPLQEAIEHPAPTDRAIGRFAALLARATLLPVEHRLPALRALMREAEQREHLSVLQHGLAREADALRQLGRHRQAARSALRAVSMADAACLPHDLYLGEFWWLVHQALQAAGHRQAATALSRGEAWVRDQALPHVPDVFRDSFLNRNAVNRQLLAAAQRARAR
jgi:tetratricopeptide (TPR) repeat protein